MGLEQRRFVNNFDCDIERDALMGLVDGSLAGGEADALEGHIAGCARCQEELQWLREMTGDLEALGDAVHQSLPTISLVDSVMAEVARMQVKPPANVVQFEKKPRRSSSWPRWLSVPAAAAAVLLVLWGAGYRVTRTAPSDVVAKVDHHGTDISSKGGELRGTEWQSDVTTDIARPVSPDDGTGANSSPSAEIELDGLTTTQVLATLKNGVSDPKTRSQLAEWATLSEDKARALLASLDASPEALIGAASALSGEEAERALQAAVKASPDDPYLRYALANVTDDPTKQAAQLEAMTFLDPNNSMARFQLAANYLSQGDVDQASSALENARSLLSASAYSKEASTYHERALVESGMDAAVARALTALTAGSNQYQDITKLSNELLEYGRYYQEIGEYEMAQRIFESVDAFGSQVVAGANFTNEQLAGLDTQTDAIDALYQLGDYIQVPDNVATLRAETQQIVNAFYAIGEVLNGLSGLLSNIDPNLLGILSDLILQNGDLNIQGLLAGLGL